MKKKLFAIILLVSVMTVYLPVYTNAAPIMTEISNDEIILTNAVAEQIINRYDMNSDITYQIADSIQLIGFNGDLYTYYELSPYGFAILYNRTGSLMEACYEDGFMLPISCSSSNTIYYGGFDIYAIFQNNCFINLANNKVLDSQTINYAIDLLNNVSDRLTNVQSTNMQMERNAVAEYRTCLVNPNYFRSLVDVPNNTQNTCTVIATSIVLSYYDQCTTKGDFVDTQYLQGNGPSEAFHDLLCYYVYGITPRRAKPFYDVGPSIDHYLVDKGLEYSFRVFNHNNNNYLETIIQQLENGNPIIAGQDQDLSNYETDHAVAIYGVIYNESNIDETTTMYVFHRGYDNNTNYEVSAIYFHSFMYLREDSRTHTYSDWESYNDQLHFRSCISCQKPPYYLPHVYSLSGIDYNDAFHKIPCHSCNHEKYEMHADYWNEATSRCLKCNHTGNLIIPINNIIDPMYSVCLCE